MFGRGSSFSDSSDDETQIDLSPMIDCIFILLIFFIVTTVFVEETGVTVNKPDLGGAASSLESNSILLAITDDDKVYYGGKSVGVAGVQAAIRPLLIEDPDIPVIIQGDIAASHGTVQEVHGQAINAGAKREKISISSQ